MVIITCLYLALVYLLFFKFKLLPWNKISQGQSSFRLTRCHSNRGATNWKRGCNSHN